MEEVFGSQTKWSINIKFKGKTLRNDKVKKNTYQNIYELF